MSKASLPRLTILCAALAACADASTNRTLTAPDARPSLNETAADAGVSYTVDGPPDAGLGSEDSAMRMAGAEAMAALAASPQAASGDRAMGHVGLTFPANPGIVSEKYSFTALRTDLATPDAAKGQYEVTYTTGAGTTIKIHGDVSCMNVFGNNARAAGPIRKVWRNGVQIPITANTHAFWVVVDNGEGSSMPPDQVSLVRFSNAAIAQTFCATGFLSFVFANQEGNVQVRP